MKHVVKSCEWKMNGSVLSLHVQFQSLTFGKRKTFSPWKQKQKLILIVSMLLYFHIMKNNNFQLSTFGVTSFRWKALTFC